MYLDPKQVRDLLKIIDGNQAVIIGKELGPDYLSLGDKSLLKDNGIDVETMYKPEEDTVFTSFNFGLLSQALGQTFSENLSYLQLKEYISGGKYIPLTLSEITAINTIKNQTFSDLNRLKGRIFQDVNQFLTTNSLKAQQEFLRTEIATGIENKKGISEIAHGIAEKTGDWSRDFEKIVAYNSQLAYEHGKAAMIKRDSVDEDPEVYKMVFEGACKNCIRLYLTNGTGSEPIVYKMSQLVANGSNIGRKADEWLPTVDPIHPYCFDKETEVLTDEGWKLFKDLNKSEKFLSVDLKTGDAEWVKAINWIEHKYTGKMHSFKNKNFDLVTSPNHHHVIQTYSSQKLRLVETVKLPKEAQFLKHIPNWIGKEPNYKFDDKVFESKLFTKFLGFFFSEGSAIDYKGRLTLHIAQSQAKYLDEIYNCCKQLFIKVYKCKDYVQVTIGNNHKELWHWLSSFGKANAKRVPIEVKESTQELIDVFLEAYCKGDGSFVKGREWDGYTCHDSRLYYTSSKLMADDLGELMLKLGNCPSYTFKEAQTIFDPKRSKAYTQNQGIWIVNKCTNKYVYHNLVQKELIDYDDFIYDVELEKYHTLLVRRNGKVCVSGNCRCILCQKKKDAKWDADKQTFIAGPYKSKRKPIRFWIGDKEYYA
jgi:hypothetical protein